MIDPVDTVTLPLPVTTDTPIRMRFATADRSYTAWLTQDLFGTWTVMQSWCGKHTHLGGGKVLPVASFEEGREVLLAIEKRRYRHGYARLE